MERHILLAVGIGYRKLTDGREVEFHPAFSVEHVKKSTLERHEKELKELKATRQAAHP
ncbi:MAG: hypothetical protein ACW99U_10275 [Candidatus Thorarchaeota archaeon]|jgi:hypothetical protein